MHFRGRAALRAALAILVLPPVVALAGVRPGVGSPQPAQPALRKTADLTPVTRAVAAKTPVSRLARSDESLLARTDSAPVQVVVKLDYEPVATYAGTLPGLPATGPAHTGRPLAGTADEERYEEHIRTREAAVLDTVARRVPAAVPGQRLRTVYGGVTFTAPANRLRELASVPGVVAVQADSVRKPLTDSSAEFIGAAPDGVNGAGAADGAGVLVGVLDTGAWPEHPSFAETRHQPGPAAQGRRHAAHLRLRRRPDRRRRQGPAVPLQPQARSAAPRSCPATSPTQSARPRRSTAPPATPTATGRTPRRRPSATWSTRRRCSVSTGDRCGGVAPGAWLSVYKVCGAQGCFASDSVAAIGQAIRDGVQVINFSISGGTSPQTDPVGTGVPRRVRGRGVRRRVGGQRRARRRDGEPPRAVGHHGGRVDPAPRVRLDADPDERRPPRRRSRARRSPPGSGRRRWCWPRASPGTGTLCGTKPPADAFTGRIVACERGGNVGRVDKGNNVKAGGAVGMILYNPTLQDIETDNHWLPTVHLADGAACRKFLTDHKDVTGSFTAGAERTGRADVMAAFSSRGPAGCVHQARRHRARRPDPGRAHADARGARRGPARRAVPGHRRHVDVVAARGRRAPPG